MRERKLQVDDAMVLDERMYVQENQGWGLIAYCIIAHENKDLGVWNRSSKSQRVLIRGMKWLI